MPATDILGKIGEKVGTEFSNLKVSLGNIYATQSALSSLQASVSANTSSISSNATGISNNASAISTNSSNISANTSAIQSNDSDITALQTKTSALATNGNSAIFSGDLNAQNLTLSGDLTVNGTTTTLNTQTVEIEDNIIEVNLAPTTGNETAQTGGLQVNRGSGNDKAQIIWDDSLGAWKLLQGTSATKIYYANMFSAIANLPSASTYHGMFAHVHATGRGYYAHGGNWVELIDKNADQTLNGDLLFSAGKAVKVADGSGIVINQVSLGNYASFETQFNANK